MCGVAACYYIDGGGGWRNLRGWARGAVVLIGDRLDCQENIEFRGLIWAVTMIITGPDKNLKIFLKKMPIFFRCNIWCGLLE